MPDISRTNSSLNNCIGLKAVNLGLIDAVGGLKDAVIKHHALIEAQKTNNTEQKYNTLKKAAKIMVLYTPIPLEEVLEEKEFAQK